MAYSSPTKRSPRAAIADGVASRERVVRSPSMRFNLKTLPYDIQPFAIMPVWPAEGLKNILLQSQVWSDPLASGMKNIGWWCEYYFFYVKWRDLAGYDTDGQIGKEMSDMMVSNASLAAFQDVDGNAWTYCYPGGVDFLFECSKRVVDEYFRDEGENWDDYLNAAGVPKAKIYGRGGGDAFQRLTLATAYADRRVNMPTHVGDEMTQAEREWHAMTDMGMLDMDFQDWMRAYGSDVRPEQDSVRIHRPELVGYRREFTYPTNTVEPTTGVPATAVGWRVKQRFDEYKFFKEPGWLVGYTCVRPKVYLGKQQGSISNLMQTRATWLPPQLMDVHTVSHILVDDAAGPLKAVMDAGNIDYWMDIRDYMNYGDQFINYATPASGASGVPFVALPTAAGLRRYAADAEIHALFSDTVNGLFRQDGVADLTITGRVAKQRPQDGLVMAQM